MAEIPCPLTLMQHPENRPITASKWDQDKAECIFTVKVHACMCYVSPVYCLYWRTNNPPALFHMGRGSSWDEPRMINKHISPGCKLGDFIYYFSFNWLPQVGFLTWCTINVLLFMCLINDRWSSMTNTLNCICDWRTAAVCAVWQHRGQHRYINQGKWNSIRQSKSSGPNCTIFHIVVVLPLWQYRRSGFPLDPEIHFESTLLSTMTAAVLRFVCSEAAAAPSALCDTVFVFAECGISYSMCCTFHIWWRAGLFCLQTKMYKLTVAHTFIPAAHV